MKTFNIRLTFVLLLSVLLLGCASTKTESRDRSSDAYTLTCEVFYRSDPGQGLEAAAPIIFTGGNEQKEYAFENMAFEAQLQDDQFEGRALYTAVINLETGDEISRQLFQFDPKNPVENQFVGGHGFTGLNYVFHPVSSAEMQYFCRVEQS